MSSNNKPNPIPFWLNIIILISIIVAPILIVYYAAITDISNDRSIETSEFTFEPNTDTSFIQNLGMIFESTDIFLQVTRNNSAPGLVTIFLLPLGEFNLFNDGERNVASDDRIAELGSIEGNNETEEWINATANLEIEYFVVLVPTGITNTTLIEVMYWLEIPALIFRQPIAVLGSIGVFYLVAFYGRNYIHSLRLKRYRKQRQKERDHEELEFYNKRQESSD